jgi:hypothetical protein
MRKYHKNHINNKFEANNKTNYTINQEILCPE